MGIKGIEDELFTVTDGNMSHSWDLLIILIWCGHAYGLVVNRSNDV